MAALIARSRVSAPPSSLARSARMTALFRAQLAAEVSRFESQLNHQQRSVEILDRFSTLFHGIVVAGDQTTMAQLAAIPGVKAVYPERLYSSDMDASLPMLEAPVFWTQLGQRSRAGEGVRVAIIDSGIQPHHPMFSGDGFPPPRRPTPVDDYCATTQPSFCNNKLVVARWIPPTFAVWPGEHLSPLGFNGHGSHVAGTAVGNEVSLIHHAETLTLSGVAPGAQLMVYKALYASASDPTRATGSNIMLLQALEHAVNDGADVINNSWGGSAGMDPALTPFWQAFEAAEQAGIVVVNSAGNSGPTPQSIGCPGCIPNGITVANTTHGRFFAHRIAVDSQPDIYALEGLSASPLNHDIRAPLIAAEHLDKRNANGCQPFVADGFAAAIALIRRGQCPFSTKAQHAVAAGARALVVYNDRPDPPLIMTLQSVALPAVMISQSAGEGLLKRMAETTPLLATLQADVRRVEAPELGDHTALSSSRGPNGNPSMLKPDIAAPGTHIFSAISPENPDHQGHHYTMLTGTSMASPHVAGAAALLRSMHPDWSALEIKTALTSTARWQSLKQEDGETPATPFDVGAGRLDLEAASRAILTFDSASYANPACITICVFNVTVTNRSQQTTQWTLEGEVKGAEVSVHPERLELAPGSSALVTVTINAILSEKARWHFGALHFRGPQPARLPLAIQPDTSSDASTALIYSDDPSIVPGETATHHARFINKRFDGNLTLEVRAGGPLQLIKDSVALNTQGQARGTMQVDDDAGLIHWTGTMSPPSVAIKPVTVPAYPSLASEANRLDCLGSCDETSLVYGTRLPFQFNGRRYEQLTISSNGFVAAGETRTNDTWMNARLPNTRSPNNVIAPFWTDLDLQGDGGQSDNGKGGGTIHLYAVEDDNGQPVWLVVDWINAQRFDGSSDETYSFGVWLGVGSNLGQNLMRYYAMGPTPATVTIGAEESTGSLGDSVYFDGTGTLPAADSALLVDIHPASQLQFDFNLILASTERETQRSGSTPEEQPLTLSLDALSQSNPPLPLTLTASQNGNRIEALHLLPVTPPEEMEIRVIAPPRHGTVTVEPDHRLRYQPNPDFFGEDRLRLEFRDAQGQVLERQTLILNVTNVNDAPRADALPDVTAQSGEPVSVTLSARDADGDPVLWHIHQTRGPNVDLSVSDTTLTFTAPNVTQSTELTFAVKADDGNLLSDAVPLTVRVLADDAASDTPSGKSGGGALGWLWLMMLFARVCLMPGRHQRPGDPAQNAARAP